MSFLIVVSHPDDEVLGAGATIYKLTQSGKEVNVCIMSSGVEARTNRPKFERLDDDIKSSMAVLGVNRVIKGSFPNIELNNVPHIKLVQFIEHSLIETQAQTIITHHPADVNNDHLHTSLACQAAIRLYQRKQKEQVIKELLFMEVPSATEWSLNKSLNQFSPNVYIEVGKDGIEKNLKPLQNTLVLCGTILIPVVAK